MVNISPFGEPCQLAGSHIRIPIPRAPLSQLFFQLPQLRFNIGGDFITEPGEQFGYRSAENEFVSDCNLKTGYSVELFVPRDTLYAEPKDLADFKLAETDPPPTDADVVRKTLF